jgi:hypothetical protein
MLRAYKKCEGFSTVAERDDTIRVTDNLTGDEAYITLSDSWKMALQPNERLLAGRAAKKRYYEQLLRHNRVVSLFADGEHVVAGSDAITTLSVLLSAKTPQDKIRMLEQRGILKPGDTAAQRILMEYREDAQLAERYGRLAQGEPLAGPAVAATGTAPPAGPPVASAGAPAAHGPDAASSWPAPAFAAAAAVACALALLARRKRRTR